MSDVSTPTFIDEVSDVKIWDANLEVYNDYAIVVNGPELQVYTVFNNEIVKINQPTTSTYMQYNQIRVINNFVYVGGSRLEIYNISDQGILTLTDHSNLEHPGSWAKSIEIFDNYLYYINFDEFGIFDISNPDKFNFVRAYSNYSSTANEYFGKIGNMLYISHSFESIDEFDISDPEAPLFVQSIIHWFGGNTTQPFGFTIVNETGYISRGYSGFSIVSLNKTNPEIYSTFDSPTIIYENMAYSEDLNYVVHSDALSIYNVSTNQIISSISDFTFNQYRGSSFPTIYLLDVEIEKNTLAVSTGDGLYLLNVSDPKNPEFESFNNYGVMEDIEIVNNIVYIAKARFETINVTDPSTPRSLDILDLGHQSRFIDIYNDIAAVGDSEGLSLVDVSDPGNLTKLGEITMNLDYGGPLDVLLTSNHLLVSHRDNLVIYDITNLPNIVEVRNWELFDFLNFEDPGIQSFHEMQFDKNSNSVFLGGTTGFYKLDLNPIPVNFPNNFLDNPPFDIHDFYTDNSSIYLLSQVQGIVKYTYDPNYVPTTSISQSETTTSDYTISESTITISNTTLSESTIISNPISSLTSSTSSDSSIVHTSVTSTTNTSLSSTIDDSSNEPGSLYLPFGIFVNLILFLSIVRKTRKQI